LLETAEDDAWVGLVAAVEVEHRRLEKTADFETKVAVARTLDVRAVSLRLDTGEETEESGSYAVSVENLQDLFDKSGRRLGEGLHKVYWRRMVAARGDAEASVRAKIEIAVLAGDAATRDRVESVARALANEWLTGHRAAIARLPELDRNVYRQLPWTRGHPHGGHGCPPPPDRGPAARRPLRLAPLLRR